MVVLNPAHVIAPYDKNNWGRIFLALRDSDLPAIAKGEASLTHVKEEVVKAHFNAVEDGRNGHRYLLAGDTHTFEEFFRTAARLAGVDNLPPKVPDFVLKVFAKILEATANLTGKEPDVTPELAHIMTRKGVTYSSQKAIEELDYKIVPMEQSVRDCHDWLRREGYL